MVTTHRFSRRFWIITSIAILLAVGAFMYFLTPPVFVQAGNHYFGGPDLTRVGGVYRCDPVGQENCIVTRESLVAAVANDPNLTHWWPVRMEFLSFE
jgi:hypothetical protein